MVRFYLPCNENEWPHRLFFNKLLGFTFCDEVHWAFPVNGCSNPFC